MKPRENNKRKKKKYLAPEIEKFRIDDLAKKWNIMSAPSPDPDECPPR